MNESPPFKEISSTAAAEWIKAGACRVIDVRTPQEFASHRIREALLLPMQELQQRHGEIPQHSELPLLIVCEHGIRSVAVCQTLAHHGWTNLYNLTGGMAQWMDCRLPTVINPE